MTRFVSVLAIALLAGPLALPYAFASSAANAEGVSPPVPTATEAHQERATGLPSGLLSVPVSTTGSHTV